MYYPLSQITPNLTTSNGDFILVSNGETYIGDYYATSDGKYFSGKTPQDGPNNLIIPNDLNNSQQDVEPGKTGTYNTEIPNTISYLPPSYINAVSMPMNKANAPTPSIILPTDKDYEIGEFQRYFLKRNNSLKYIEIDVDTYNNYKTENPQTQYQLYTPTYINWNISGDPIDVYNTNRKLSIQTVKNLKWYGFEQSFKSKFCKYFKPNTQNFFYTKGSELKVLSTGENYVGYYHIHSNRGVIMEGKFHKEAKHEILVPFIGKEKITKTRVSIDNEVGTSIRKNISRESGY